MFPNAAKINCLEPRSVDHAKSVSVIQKNIARGSEALRRNPEMQNPGLTALTTSELSGGRRDASSLVKKRFRSFEMG